MSAPKQTRTDVAPAGGYTSVYRAVEIGSITAFTAMLIAVGVRVAHHVVAHPWVVATAFIAGYFAADFVCGFFHWGADTWGTARTVIVGNPLIRPFREHHVDPKGMTHHDFIETNGTNCFTAMPGFVVPLALSLEPTGWFLVRLFVVAFFASLLLWAMGTNQFHKWAHTDHPPRVAVLLQRARIILPPVHHGVHHVAPFDEYYCITSGWMNWPLKKLHFFSLAERVVVATLHWRPRQDDPDPPVRAPVGPLEPS